MSIYVLVLHYLTFLFIQHGQPQQIVDVGQTEIDEMMFEGFLDELRETYTADKVSVVLSLSDMLLTSNHQYHLLGALLLE